MLLSWMTFCLGGSMLIEYILFKFYMGATSCFARYVIWPYDGWPTLTRAQLFIILLFFIWYVFAGMWPHCWLWLRYTLWVMLLLLFYRESSVCVVELDWCMWICGSDGFFVHRIHTDSSFFSILNYARAARSRARVTYIYGGVCVECNTCASTISHSQVRKVITNETKWFFMFECLCVCRCRLKIYNDLTHAL